MFTETNNNHVTHNAFKNNNVQITMVPNDSVLKEHTANKVREKNMFAIPPHQKPEERFLCSTNCHKSYTRIANMSFPTPGNRNYAV